MVILKHIIPYTQFWNKSLLKASIRFLHHILDEGFLGLGFFLIFIVIQLQLYAFFSPSLTPPQLNPPPSSTFTLSLGFVPVSFILVPDNPSPHYPLPTTPWLLLDCS